MFKLFLQLIIGFGVGIYGYLIPSYINLGVFQAGMNNPIKTIRKILVIIALVEIPYCFICMNGMQWIMQQTLLLEIIKWLIVILLFSLSVMTFINAKKESKSIEEGISKTKSLNTKQLLIYAILNPFQLSAWAIWGTYFIEKTWFTWNPFSIFIFSIGASLGVYLILYLYAIMGQKLVAYFSENKHRVNYSIAVVLFTLGIIQLIRNLI